MLDVDHFKRLNDTHGHDVGDRVLQEVARRLMEAVRAEDVVCRYGGEEFVAILPGATEELARARAEAFRQQLASGLATRDGALPSVTISAGVAMARDRVSPDRLLRRADEALLAAKRTGRDRVVVADAPAPPSTPREPGLRLAAPDGAC
jgi:diguanylate cyclase (GGDEF)-like protein